MDGLWRLICFIARSCRRLAIFVVGLGIVAVGFVLIPAPGPGWLVVFAGLALLATEFAWAEMLLDRAKDQATKAKNMAVRSVNARRRTTARVSPDGDDELSAEGGTTHTAPAISPNGELHPVDAASEGDAPAHETAESWTRGNGGRANDFEEITNNHRSP